MLSHPCVFVNEPKLLDLKMILIQKHGLRAEFVGGVLNIEDTVAIKRVTNPFLFHHILSFSLLQNEAGKITLEGALSDTYYKVRRILYEQYAIL